MFDEQTNEIIKFIKENEGEEIIANNYLSDNFSEIDIQIALILLVEKYM